MNNNIFNFLKVLAMKKKNRLLKVGLLLAFLFAFGTSQNMFAAITFTASASGNWTTPGTWTASDGSLTKYPGSNGRTDDIVIIPAFTVNADGNGSTYTIGSLTLNDAASVLKPVNGDTVSLRLMGNITFGDAGAQAWGVNTNGRLNFEIGDGVTTGVSSTITLLADANGTVGLNIHHLTVNRATVTYGGDFSMRISGNYSVNGISSFAPAATTDGTVELYGGYASGQTVTIGSLANVDLVNVTVNNNANISWDGSFTMREILTVTSGSLICNNGTASWQPGAATDAISVAASQTLRLFNVEFINNFAVTPSGNFTVQGSFSKAGTAAFNHHTNTGTLTFRNTAQKELTNASSAANLVFNNIAVYNGSVITTSSDFQIDGTTDVQGSGKFKAEIGTITLTANATTITNSNLGTLEFFNLAVGGGTITTASDFTIKGNFDITTGSFAASAGEITFNNVLQKTITNTIGSLTFFKVKIADGSRVVLPSNATTGSFTVSGVEANGKSASITVEGTGSLVQGALGVVTFDGNATSYAKTITKSSAGTLTFGVVSFANTANNNVTTTSDFTVQGATFSTAGANASFTASSPSTITFTATNTITSATAAKVKFNNILANNAAVTLAADSYIELTGDVTVNNTNGQFLVTASTGATGSVLFNGTNKQQKITTTTPSTLNALPVSIARLVVNKTGGSTTTLNEVLMELPVSILDNANSALTLTNGYLNLGSKTLTVGAGTFTQTSGAINGGTGTYNIATTATAVTLGDALFTVGTAKTCYNMNVGAAETIDADLTINGNLSLTTGALTVANNATLTILGNLTRTAGTFTTGGANTKIALRGTGTTNGLANAFFTASTSPNLVIGRAEALAGALTMTAAHQLTIDCGINYLDLATFVLTLSTGGIRMESGSILAGDNSTIVFNAAVTKIPANMCKDNKCGNLTYGAAMTLAGDLEVRSTLTGAFNITTGDNTFTLGPNSVATASILDGTHFVYGNLKRTVSEIATLYPISNNGTDYAPLTLQFANIGSSQLIKVSAKSTEPSVGKGGHPGNTINTKWTVTPVAAASATSDSLKMTYQWLAAYEDATPTNYNMCIPAKWNVNTWTDYRNNTGSGAVAAPRVLAMSSFPVPFASLSGEWTVFVGTTRQSAIDGLNTALNKVAITKIDPSPRDQVTNLYPFKVTVQLQDQYGNPVTATADQTVTIGNYLGTSPLTAGTITGTITTGSSSTILSGLAYGAATAGESSHILISAVTAPLATAFQPGVSSEFSVLGSNAQTQANTLGLAAVVGDITSEDITWVAGSANSMVVIKANEQLADNEKPVDGTTYIANHILGAGSSIGNATVAFKGNGTSVRVAGLAPMTTYYVYVFNYIGTDGNEVYKTSAAAKNPNVFTSGGSSYDDDANYGINDTRATSKKIGTNTPIKGTIKSATDVDWFNFTITNNTPNARIELSNVPANYNIELYNSDGRRIRRGIRSGTGNEGPVINNLPAGTYTVKVYGVDGVFDTTNPYTLKINTKSTEIFSVTE